MRDVMHQRFGLACLAVLLAAGMALGAGCSKKRHGVEVTDGYFLRFTTHAPARVADAAESVFTEWGLAKTQDERGDEQTELVGRDRQGVTWRVDVRPKDTATRLAVRVEPDADQGKSLKMINAIMAKLSG